MTVQTRRIQGIPKKIPNKSVIITHGKCFPLIVLQWQKAKKEKTLKKICNEGGSRSAKTFDAFLFFFWYALANDGQEKIIRVFRETNVTCKDNTFETDFKTAIEKFGLQDEFEIKSMYARCRTTTIYFSGLQSGGVIREAAFSHVCFFNEAMENKKEIVDKWVMRCEELAIFDWNPAATEHWLFDLELDPDCVFTHSTFKDNPNCPPAVVKTLLSYEPTEENIKNGTANEYLWNVYGLGLRTVAVGMMYEDGFDEYEIIPTTARAVRKNRTDTADTGTNYLCSICYIETEQFMYVTDIVYTDKSMEYSEVATAQMLIKEKTQIANIESNNGGRGFSRNVDANIKQMGVYDIIINTFHQGANKETRIFTNSGRAQKLIKFPVGWKQKWQEFSRHLLGYKKEGKNAFDDAPDVISGMVEDFQTDRLFTESNTLYFNPNIFKTDETDKDKVKPAENKICIVVKDDETDYFCSVVYSCIGGKVYVLDTVVTQDDYNTVTSLIINQCTDYSPDMVKMYVPKEFRNYVDRIRENSPNTSVMRADKRFNDTEHIEAKSSLVIGNFYYLEKEQQNKQYNEFMQSKHNYMKGEKKQQTCCVLCDSIAATYYNVLKLLR